MKKIVFLIGFLILVLACIWYFMVKLDYKKIIFILPSSERASSPYYYQKDGDFFLAQDLSKGFEKLGYKVEYRFREHYDDLKFGNAGNIIYFKGYYKFEHLPENKEKNDGRNRILYLYYIEGFYPDIMKEVDVVACASQKFIDEIIVPNGVQAVYVPQFTNPDRFKSSDIDDKKSHSVLFVGSDHNGFGRKSVDYAILAGADLSVYGKFWDKTLETNVLKGNFIDNDELYKYYANADIVLNDHRYDMAYYGFISNRIYDVTASGGFIFTDYLPEIEKVYGDSIAMYKDYYEFKEKLEFYLANSQIRADMAKRAQKITLERFTNLKIAQIFDEILKNIKK